MGYNLTIGEASIKVDDEFIYIGAEPASDSDAPDHCPYTGKGNTRSPSYTAWSDFCKQAGVYELFYGDGWSRTEMRNIPKYDFYRETILLQDHPGAAVIIPEDLEYVRKARKNYEINNGGKEAGFWDEYDVDNGKDPTLARLLWLEFWIEWALKNCKNPIMANS